MGGPLQSREGDESSVSNAAGRVILTARGSWRVAASFEIVVARPNPASARTAKRL